MKTKNLLLITTIITSTLTACGSNDTKEPTTETTPAATPMALAAGANDSTDSCDSDIPVDSANKMISSYITSLGGNSDDQNLYSLIVDANCLRSYLSNTNVKKVKLMFAHTLNYINSGHQGQNCGYKSGELTLVIAGYDASGNYVLTTGGNVMDGLNPCPHNCPNSGTASSNTIPTE